MSVPPDFEDALGESLDVIDRALAKDEVPLRERPLRAAKDLVTYCVMQVRVGEEISEPGKFLDYMATDWFKAIYARTVGWYTARYGEAVSTKSDETHTGCILVLDTPFAMRIPVVTKRPGTPGETIWVCFPKEVEEDEDPLAWITGGPDVHALPRSDGLKVRRLAIEIANAVRGIVTSIMAIELPTERVEGMRDAILPHLDRAASLIARDRPEERKHAQWDLQMACELFLKLLTEQRAGSFKESHDLYHLFDSLPSGSAPFKRTVLSGIPNWQLMAEWALWQRSGHQHGASFCALSRRVEDRGGSQRGRRAQDPLRWRADRDQACTLPARRSGDVSPAEQTQAGRGRAVTEGEGPPNQPLATFLVR